MTKKGKDQRIENAQIFLNYDEPLKLLMPVLSSIYDIITPTKTDAYLVPPGQKNKELTDYGNDREDSKKTQSG